MSSPRFVYFMASMAALALVVLPGCSREGELPPAGYDTVRSTLEREGAEVESGQLATLVAGNTEFALALHRVLGAQPGNLAFSPHGISSALAMVHAGARGETERQLTETLRFRLPPPTLHEAFNTLDRSLTAPTSATDAAFTLNIVNALWKSVQHPLKQAYLDVIGRHYGAAVRRLDFARDPEGARRTINAWVADATAGRIEDLLPAGSLTALTRLVLTNAVYFNADWVTPFEPARTTPASFRRLDGSEREVPTMQQEARLAYARVAGTTAVQLPYAGDRAALLLLMPDTDFPGFEARLEAGDITAFVDALEPTRIALALPRFEHRYRASLVAAFEAMGVNALFDPNRADLSGIDGGRDLHVSEVAHEVFIRVDEAGTEAAAATGVVIGVTAMPAPAQPVRFDRPFLYLVRDLDTGAVLFMGRVVDP